MSLYDSEKDPSSGAIVPHLEVARLAAQRREEKHINTMKKSLEILNTDSNSAEGYADADETFHKVLIDASKNPLLGIMIRSIMVNLHISRQWSIRHFGVAVVIEEHKAIFEAIKNKEAITAAQSSKDLASKAGNEDYVALNNKNIAKWQSMK